MTWQHALRELHSSSSRLIFTLEREFGIYFLLAQQVVLSCSLNSELAKPPFRFFFISVNSSRNNQTIFRKATNTIMASYHELVETLRSNFKSGITSSRQYRINQVNNFKKMLEEGESDLVEALKKDLSKPSAEAINFEIDFIKNVIKSTMANFDR